MRMEPWLLVGLLLVPAGCVPSRDAAAPPPALVPRAPAGTADYARAHMRDYAAIDAHALRAPRAAERSLDALAVWLVQPARDDAERARALFRWITARIAYDAPAYFSGRYRNARRAAADVLRHRVAVCDGYAQLFAALAGRAGLEAVVVTGHGKGFAYRPGRAPGGPPDHAWNAVRIAGHWYLLDATWGAGTLDAETHRFQPAFEPHFFLTPPEQFIYRHLPDDPQWQLLEHPLTAAQFAALAVPSPAFFRDGLALAQPVGATLHAAGELSLRLHAPPAVRLTAQLLRGEREVGGVPAFVQREGGAVAVHVRPPRRGDYTLRVLSKPDPAAALYEGALELRVVATDGVGGGAGFPLVYRPFAEREARLDAPRRGHLRAGTEERFRLYVPGALQVGAVLGGRFVALGGGDGAFEGTLHVPRGPFVLYARFAPDRPYAGLLRFEGI